MRLLISLIATMLAFGITTAHAGENVKGFGAVECRKIIELLTDKDENTQVQAYLTTFSWVQGHFTGRNLAVSEFDQRDLTDMTPETVMEDIAGLCLKNPNVLLYQIAESLYTDLPYYKATPGV